MATGCWRWTPDDAGLGERWFDAAARKDAMAVTVPSVWDRWAPDYDGVGWLFPNLHA